MILKRILEENTFMRFDLFLLKKMGIEKENSEITREDRMEGYHRFRKKTGDAMPATIPTMKKWFGIDGITKPYREQLYAICFALQLSLEESEEYLTEGIGEPSFQMNDYHEMIYVYGLQQKVSYESCQRMIELFEEHMDLEVVFEQTRKTDQLQKAFLSKKDYSPEEFLMWMNDNARYFKGYSKTSLDYLKLYKKEVLRYIRKDAAERLNNLLSETDFENWSQKKKFSQKVQREMIQQYIMQDKKKKNRKISETLANNILELSKISYSKIDSNSLVLSEIFVPNEQLNRNAQHHKMQNIYNMTTKHLSDLLNVAEQKEMSIRVAHAIRILNMEEVQDSLWKSIQQMIYEYSNEKVKPESKQEAKKWLIKFQKEHRRRQLLVQRGDILPLVLYVAQQKYLDQIHNKWEFYIKKDAVEVFSNMADGVLTACRMLPLNEKYELDAVLYSCYQEEEMFTYSDVLETLYGKNEIIYE